MGRASRPGASGRRVARALSVETASLAYRSADEYIAALRGLHQITVGLDVKKIMAEADDAAVFFELQTRAPADATVLVAEWHHVVNGKIAKARSAFDARPYEAMFTSSKPGKDLSHRAA